ncbi:MAG: hypothetical protein H0U09_12305, partial [Geodermatophilaceae bacterium]|nr:hypothetical protein [Geodermatophilaceae bacterium]
VMGRCLADVLPSTYQEKVKQRDPDVSWPDFLGNCDRPDGMWGHRLGPLVERWQAAFGAQHVHVVTVPPRAVPRRRLLDRFARVVGFEAAGLDVRPADTNDSLDMLDVVLLQHVVRRTRATLSWHEHRDLMSRLVPVLRTADRPRQRLLMPASARRWMEREAAESIRAVSESGCRVYGDLADLLPRAECFSSTGSGLAAVSTAEVLEAAVDALLTTAFRADS